MSAQPILKPFAAPPPPRLLDRVREACRVRHYSIRTEDAYADWIKRFILFHDKRHPQEMGAAEINRFLTHLAVVGNVAASTQNQAFSALLFLYQKVLEVDPGRIEGVIRARRPKRLPVVLTRSEVRLVLAQLMGTYRLIGQVLYGSGLRLLECLRLRVKDLDFEQGEILVREGKGDKDRRTVLPEALKPDLGRHLEAVRRLHEQDLAKGFGKVYLPHALDRKLPTAAGEGCWQYVFPSAVRDVVASFVPETTGHIRIVLERPGPLVTPPLPVEVEVSDGLPEGARTELAKRIEERIRSRLSFKAEIRFLAEGELPRTSLKTQYIRKAYET